MTFLLTHWRLGLALILTAVLGSYILVLKAELRYETGKRAEAETKVAQLTAAVTQWQEAVKEQNLAVEGWKAAAIVQDRNRKDAEANAAHLRSQIPQKVQEILESKISSAANVDNTSSQPPVSCEDAIQWLRDQAPTLSSW